MKLEIQGDILPDHLTIFSSNLPVSSVVSNESMISLNGSQVWTISGLMNELKSQFSNLLDQYKAILGDMVNLHVFTENAITLLKELMDKAQSEYETNLLKAYEKLILAGQQLSRSGEKFLSRLNERVDKEIANGTIQESWRVFFHTRDELSIVLNHVHQINDTMYTLQKYYHMFVQRDTQHGSGSSPTNDLSRMSDDSIPLSQPVACHTVPSATTNTNPSNVSGCEFSSSPRLPSDQSSLSTSHSESRSERPLEPKNPNSQVKAVIERNVFDADGRLNQSFPSKLYLFPSTLLSFTIPTRMTYPDFGEPPIAISPSFIICNETDKVTTTRRTPDMNPPTDLQDYELDLSDCMHEDQIPQENGNEYSGCEVLLDLDEFEGEDLVQQSFGCK